MRISTDPEVMGGKPCIRGMRVTVGMIVEAMAAGRTVESCLPIFLISKSRTFGRRWLMQRGLRRAGNFLWRVRGCKA